MSAPDSPPQVHGDGLTPPSEGAGAPERQGAAESDLPPRVAAAMARRDFRDLIDRSSVARDYDPLCVLDESNDMEAFAALSECALCEGTGKQVPSDFWGAVEPEDDDAIERIAEDWRTREVAAYGDHGGCRLAPWSECSESTQRWYVKHTRFLLAALRGDQP